jgi:hypothetical protein
MHLHCESASDQADLDPSNDAAHATPAVIMLLLVLYYSTWWVFTYLYAPLCADWPEALAGVNQTLCDACTQAPSSFPADHPVRSLPSHGANAPKPCTEHRLRWEGIIILYVRLLVLVV